MGFLTKDDPGGSPRLRDPQGHVGRARHRSQLAVDALSDGDNPLTERERDVLAAASTGSSIAQISKTLFLSLGTVRNYLSAAIQKLDASNRIEAARSRKRKGLDIAATPCCQAAARIEPLVVFQAATEDDGVSRTAAEAAVIRTTHDIRH